MGADRKGAAMTKDCRANLIEKAWTCNLAAPVVAVQRMQYLGAEY